MSSLQILGSAAVITVAAIICRYKPLRPGVRRRLAVGHELARVRQELPTPPEPDFALEPGPWLYERLDVNDAVLHHDLGERLALLDGSLTYAVGSMLAIVAAGVVARR